MQPWGKTVVSPVFPPTQMQAVASGRKERIGHTSGRVPGAAGPLLCSSRDTTSSRGRGSDFYVVAFAQVRCHPPWARGLKRTAGAGTPECLSQEAPWEADSGGRGRARGPTGGKVGTDQDGAELPGWPQLPLGPRASPVHQY